MTLRRERDDYVNKEPPRLTRVLIDSFGTYHRHSVELGKRGTVETTTPLLDQWEAEQQKLYAEAGGRENWWKDSA